MVLTIEPLITKIIKNLFVLRSHFAGLGIFPVLCSGVIPADAQACTQSFKLSISLIMHTDLSVYAHTFHFLLPPNVICFCSFLPVIIHINVGLPSQATMVIMIPIIKLFH